MADKQKIFLGNAFVTDQGDWVQGKTAMTNDIYHTADGAFMSLVDNNTNTPAIGADGWRVWLDEKKFNDAEAERQQVFEAKEAVRDQKVSDSVGEVQALLNAFGTTNPFCGFARVAGDADPAPSETNIFGSRSLIREIGKHIKLGTVKRVDGEAVLQHECAPGRITKASNGDAVAVDGSEGDLLLYSDAPLYLLKANETVGDHEMSCMGIATIPSFWQNHAAKKIDPFAFSPFYAVNAKLEGDERSCSHCIINDNVPGAYAVANGFVKETFKANGGGYPSNGASSFSSIHNAQNKNADANTNYPYMGGYYEFYELVLALMYAECGTLNTTDLYCMGVGCTMQETVSASTWCDERIAGNSGVKIIAADGTAFYAGLMSQSLKKGANGEAQYNMSAIVGSQYYVFTKCGESLSVLDAITQAGLQSKIGVASNVFSFDEDGVMTYSTSVDVNTGAGMESNKRYYIVRNVPNCQGLSDGVMTAVINCYVKLSVADGIYTGSTDLTGGSIIYKFSHAIYRGLAMPMDGMFVHLSGAHYLTGRTESGYYNKFYCAAKWSDVAPLKDNKVYGDIGTAEDYDILKGLTLVKSVPTPSSWISKADYSLSLFCYTQFSGGSHSHEVAYTWNSNYMWGAGVSGLPEVGKEGVKALVVGCAAVYGGASARTAGCSDAVSGTVSVFAFALAVPQLKLS